MPRIRTIKPEAFQHRKVGRLSDRAFRLWIGMIAHADDYGRIVADPDQLRCLIFGYQERVKVPHVAGALDEIAATGMIRRYHVNGTCYADFPSWEDHQRVEHRAKPKLPEYRASENPHEDSRILANLPQRSEGIGRDQGREGISNSSPTGSEVEWGRPEQLTELWNQLAPPGLARVTRLSPARRIKLARYLRDFPEREFWVRCFSELKFSKLLLGLAGSPGHENFRADLDWLLTKGKDGSENAVKTAEGKYRDKEAR